MKDLDNSGRQFERKFGLISGFMKYGIHELATKYGSNWDILDDNTIDIPVNEENACAVYSWCKEIRSGYNVRISKKLNTHIKKARLEAHLFLVAEFNNQNTTQERKIELVKLTSK